jgi:AcrR family transcriptional regulator
MAVRKRTVPQPKLRRREEPAVRRAQILRASRTCFANAGFNATTVDDIAAEAGVSVGLLYRVFGSKTAIIEAIILDQVEEQIEQAFEIISTSPASGIDRTKVIKSFEDASQDMQSLALTFEIAAEACRNAQLRAFMQSRRAKLYATLLERLTEAGMSRKTAERMFAELDLVGAIGSGALVQSLSSTKTKAFANIEAVFRAADRGAKKRSDK